MTEMGNLCCPLIFFISKRRKKSFEGGRRRAEGGNLKVEGRRQNNFGFRISDFGILNLELRI
jgi:hypothetical protein